MGENLLKEGAATFYIVDSKLEHRDDDPFILWLSTRLLHYGTISKDVW